jgi:hypothetical protein
VVARLKILIFCLSPKWITIARLPRALQRAGFEVGVACSERSVLITTRFRDRTFILPHRFCGETILRKLIEIVRDWQPDLLLPADDNAVLFLSRVNQLVSTTSQNDTDGLAVLLRRSLGKLESLTEATSKQRTIERARRLGLRVPSGCVVESTATALDFARSSGFPVVLKRSFSWGGSGVTICHEESDLLQTWQRLWWRCKVKNRLYTWCDRLRGRRAASFWMPADQSITINQYIPGEPAMCQVVAVNGRVLAGAAAHKIQCTPDAKGPSSVLRFVAGGEMLQMASALTCAWELTGFLSFDFMVDAADRPWLVECNPRATAIAHLSRLTGDDLCELYYRHFAGIPESVAPKRRELEVALFPQEWRRDPASPYLTSIYHDVPWDDLDLMSRLMQQC